MLTNILLLLACSISFISSDLTVPPRGLGFTYRTSNASRAQTVTLDVYLDYTCPDSKQTLPTVMEVADQLEGENFELVVHSFSLPYHRNSHVITEAVHLVDKYTNPKSKGVYAFLKVIYDNLDKLSTQATRDMTDIEVLEFIKKIANDVSGIPSATFDAQIKNYDSSSRLEFKYGCTRGVYGTPTFMVNDVVVSATPSWTTEQWMNLIKPLL